MPGALPGSLLSEIIFGRVSGVSGVNHPMPAAEIVSVDFVGGGAVLFVDEDLSSDGEGVVEDWVCGCVWARVGRGWEGWWYVWRGAL